MARAKPVGHPCKTPDCTRPAEARGYCKVDYNAARARGEFSTTSCSEDGCDAGVVARGLCARHYRKARYHGTFEDLPKCSVEGCPTAAYAEGLCGKHYTRLRTYGSTADRQRPLPLPAQLRARFATERATEDALRAALGDLVAVNGECWDWQGGLSPDGYAVATRNVRVSRLVLELVGRPAAPTQHARHGCHRPCCIRPKHLSPGSALDNKADAAAADRIQRGERHHNARLTDAQVEALRKEYAAGGISQRELGIKYGVTQTAVSGIVTGKNRRVSAPREGTLTWLSE